MSRNQDSIEQKKFSLWVMLSNCAIWSDDGWNSGYGWKKYSGFVTQKTAVRILAMESVDDIDWEKTKFDTEDHYEFNGTDNEGNRIETIRCTLVFKNERQYFLGTSLSLNDVANILRIFTKSEDKNIDQLIQDSLKNLK